MKCYEGNLPYIFISYAHKDKETVYPLISELMNRGYRIWLDEGIRLSDEWPEAIAAHLYEAETVIFFVSQDFCLSKNCRREVNFAIDKDKDMFVVFLENVDLSLGLQLQLGTIQSIVYDKEKDLAHTINKIVLNKAVSKESLKMSAEEFDEFFDTEVPSNALVNQMTIAIGIVKYRDSVLMVKRSANNEKLSWGFPATMIKPQEGIPGRIVKETFAETGIKTKFIRYLGNRIHPDTKTITYYCALEYLNGEVENMDEYENADARWISLNEYKHIITSNLYSKVSEYLEEKND